jgi:predicted RNA-binding protein YlqC (UPF0109 family)
MKDLLEFILGSITQSAACQIQETIEEDHVNLVIDAPQEIIGLIIGKNGKTIKAIRNLLKVRATLEKKGVSLSINEKLASAS